MKRNIIFSLIIGLLIIAISSCGLAGTSMKDRVSYFEDDLNGSRANIIDNIHPDASSYNTLDDNYWAQSPWTVTATVDQFSITGISEGSSSVSGTFNSDLYTDVEIYKMCIEDFVEEQNEAIRMHQEAAQEAIDEWNNFVNYEL